MTRVLPIGYPLRLSEKEFLIKKVVGKGASSVTYLAECDRTEHILKECNPLGIPMYRNEAGTLFPDTKLAGEKFHECLSRFRAGVDNQLLFRLADDLKNTTSNIQNQYDANGTLYIDMTYFVGDTYDRVIDGTLYDLLRRVKALTRIIGHYHDLGYLHLDIKPQNIYAIPETPEMVMMFDFDSVVRKHDLAALITSSYTDTWAAPEQKLPKYRNKICEATDLFAIGEIVFFKLFGRHSTEDERYSFSQYEYPDEKLLKTVNPRVFPLLTEFFQKTLCRVPAQRFRTAEDLMKKLDELLKLTDPNLSFVRDNFTYQSSGFFGREDLLDRISCFFNGTLPEKGNTLFLSGVGGIGKTELAKRYAYLHGNAFDRIIFLPYQHSIEETLCQDSLVIYHGEEPEISKEDLAQEYRYRLGCLKTDLTSRDLIILDNFDVEDEKIEDLIEINCKFLITTRLDYSDYGYPQLDIGAIDDRNTLQKIFCQHNDRCYSAEEWEAIDELMRYVDHHTMTICLISKYLRITGVSPRELLQQMQTTEGVTTTQESALIRQRKDRRLDKKNVTEHLLTLFNLNAFSEDENNLLVALSLLGPVRVQEDLLITILGDVYSHSILMELVRKGWVDTSKDHFISLHQVILDLIFNKIEKSSSFIDSVIHGMLNYLAQPHESANARRGKSIIAKHFKERISGDGLIVAQYYYHYHRLDRHSDALDQAIKICQKYDDTPSRDLLFEIYLTRIQDHCNDDVLCADDPNRAWDEIKKSVLENELSAWNLICNRPLSATLSEEGILIHLNQLCIPDASVWGILDASKLATFLADMSVFPVLEDIQATTLEKMLSLAGSLGDVASCHCGLELELDIGSVPYMLYAHEECILRYAYLLAATTNQSDDLMVRILSKLAEFYSAEDYTQFGRVSSFSDPEKAPYYSKEAIDIRDTLEPNVLFLGGTSYMDAASEAQQREDYLKSIDLLKKAKEYRESTDNDIFERIAENYVSMGLYEKAQEYMLKVLMYNESENYPTVLTLMKLAHIAALANNPAQSIALYTRAIEENISSFDSLDSYLQASILQSYCLRSELDNRNSIDRELGQWIFQKCSELDYCDQMGKGMVPVYRHLCDYLLAEHGESAALNFVLEKADAYRAYFSYAEAQNLYEFVYTKCTKGSGDVNVLVETCIKIADLCISETQDDCTEYLLRLKELLKYPDNISELNMARYHALDVTIYSRLDTWTLDDYSFHTEYELRKKCNYYVLAEHDAKNSSTLSDAADTWKNASEDYLFVEDFQNARRCAEQYLKALETYEDKESSFYELLNHYERLLSIDRRSNEKHNATSCIEHMMELWNLPTAGDDDRIIYSMQTALTDSGELLDPIVRVYIGVLRISKILLRIDNPHIKGGHLHDVQMLEQCIFQVLMGLPQEIPEKHKDDVLRTLEIIIPLCDKLSLNISEPMKQIYENCTVNAVEEKHKT